MDYKKLIFVSGKGGTGKTTVALSVARSLALRGAKVLFCELTSRSSAIALLDSSKTLSYKPSDSGLGFDWCYLQGVDCLVDYVGSFTKVEKIAQTFFETPAIKSLLNVAPGLNDLAILGKLTSSFRKHGPGFEYDHVVVDAHSTGHFSALLAAPRLLGRSVSAGPLHTQSLAIDTVLKDKRLTQYLLVSLFEDLPVDELLETIPMFKDYPAPQIVMNKSFSLKKVREEVDPWSEFLANKMKQEQTQGRRAQSTELSCYKMNLFTNSMVEHLTQNNGGFLCPL